MRNIILIILLMTATIVRAQIKCVSYWIAPTCPKEMAEKLASDSLLIIDYENLVNNRETLELIKQLNPKLKIIIYGNQMESWIKETINRPLANELKTQIPKEFFLKKADGKPVTFWPDMELMNMSTSCSKINGKKYNEYYANWLLTKILNDSLVDGYFADNGTSTIFWVNHFIDADNNHIPDGQTKLDNSWRAGMVEFLDIIRKAKGKDFIIITNKGEKTFFFITNGVMFEKFPNKYLGDPKADGWYKCLDNASQAGPYTIFQVDYKNLEFGLASSLLLDNVYIAVGQNMLIPRELRIPTGKPLGKMYQKNGLYYRDYELIKVEVNPLKKVGKLIPKIKKTKK